MAKKRWIEKWSLEKIGDESGLKCTTVNAYLWKLRNGEIETLDLNRAERKAIMGSIRVECEKISENLKSKGRA